MTGSPITTHVLDTARGTPAVGLPVTLHHAGRTLASGVTDACGRIGDLLPPGPIEPGVYEVRFDTGAYAASIGVPTFYPDVIIRFTIERPDDHFHVPLILSPFGYTTYRGTR